MAGWGGWGGVLKARLHVLHAVVTAAAAPGEGGSGRGDWSEAKERSVGLATRSMSERHYDSSRVRACGGGCAWVCAWVWWGWDTGRPNPGGALRSKAAVSRGALRPWMPRMVSGSQQASGFIIGPHASSACKFLYIHVCIANIMSPCQGESGPMQSRLAFCSCA